MKSREFKKIYPPSLGRYVYEHRGNGLIVDNIMKPLKGAIRAAAKGARPAVAKAIDKKASKTAKAAAAKATAKAEKSGDLIRRRLTQVGAPKSRSRAREGKSSARVTGPKMSNNDVNTLINNLIARS